MKSTLVIFLALNLLQISVLGADWKPVNSNDENLEIIEDGANLCQGLSTKEARICKVIVRNFMTMVHPSRHIATTTVKPQPTSNCNETQNQLNLALSRENSIQGKLDLTQHRENELAAKLDTEIRHRTKAEQRFEFAHEREKELSNKLLSCNVEMLETRTRLHLLDSLQNYTEKRLKESQQLIDETNSKLIKFLQEKAESDLHFKLTIENLNLTNIQLRQKQADLSTRTDEVLKENAEIRSRFDRTQKYAAEASSKLEEYQKKHAATLSLLTNVNEKVADLTMKMEAAQEMEKRCQLDLSRQESEFKSNLTALQVNIQSLEECKEQGVKARDEKQRILDKMNNCTLLLQRVASKFPKLTLNQTDANLQKQLKRLLNKMIELSTGIYLFVDTSKSWSEARAFCQAQGMDLVAIESEEEDKALVTHAKSLGGRIAECAYTSGCYSSGIKGFVWRSTGKQLTYTNWGTASPRGTTDSHCIQLYAESDEWGAHADSEPFICELY